VGKGAQSADGASTAGGYARAVPTRS